MEIKGKVIQVLPLKEGESAKGKWMSQDYVLETEGEHPKKICFNVFGDKINEFAIREGEVLTVGIDPQSREYNGNWYTTIRGWKVEREAVAQEPKADDTGLPF